MPATEAENDHRIRWPRGATEPGNLWPACKRDEVQLSATEFVEVLHEIRSRHDRSLAENRALQREHDNYLFNLLRGASS